MSDAPLQRGDVVRRGRAYGVVWQVGAAHTILFPVNKPGRQQRAGDVALQFGEIIAAGIELPAAVVRAGQPMLLLSGDMRRVGALAGPVCCRLVLAAIRAGDALRVAETWDAERRHRAEARSNKPVRLVG